MDEKLKTFVSRLNREELGQFQRDLSMKQSKTRELVDRRFRELSSAAGKVCSICMADLEPTSIHNYTLIFGPQDLKKQAVFCGLDCMTYFLNQLTELKTRPLQEER